tara:strand:- start:365 stop:1363 length:999 start_codon:yes stop_codon:yes gene_type:complete
MIIPFSFANNEIVFDQPINIAKMILEDYSKLNNSIKTWFKKMILAYSKPIENKKSVTTAIKEKNIDDIINLNLINIGKCTLAKAVCEYIHYTNKNIGKLKKQVEKKYISIFNELIKKYNKLDDDKKPMGERYIQEIYNKYTQIPYDKLLTYIEIQIQKKKKTIDQIKESYKQDIESCIEKTTEKITEIIEKTIQDTNNTELIVDSSNLTINDLIFNEFQTGNYGENNRDSKRKFVTALCGSKINIEPATNNEKGLIIIDFSNVNSAMGMIGPQGALKHTWDELEVELINNLKEVLEYYGFNEYNIIFHYIKNASSLYIDFKYNLYNRVELKF